MRQNHLISSLLVKDKFPILLSLVALVVLAGHVLWLVESSTDRHPTTFSRTYFPGVFEGMYWALITVSTIGYGDKVSHRWSGRIVAALVIIISLPLFGVWREEALSRCTSCCGKVRQRSNVAPRFAPGTVPGTSMVTLYIGLPVWLLTASAHAASAADRS